MPIPNPKPPDPKSFRDVVSKNWTEAIDVTFALNCKNCLSTFKGEPALILTDEEEEELAIPFQLTLVAKFSNGRPSMASLRRDVLAASFNGEVQLGLLDHHHVFFKCENELDFHRLWLRRSWTFSGFQANFFRWSKDFNPSIESSTSPVWIKLPMLPIHLFDKTKLFSIASALGRPLKIDKATAAASKILRPSEARICVELDVLKVKPNRIWIGSKEKGRWQTIEVEDLPSYCTDCHKMGHSSAQCKPLKLGKETGLEDQSKATTLVWVPVNSSKAAPKVFSNSMNTESMKAASNGSKTQRREGQGFEGQNPNEGPDLPDPYIRHSDQTMEIELPREIENQDPSGSHVVNKRHDLTVEKIAPIDAQIGRNSVMNSNHTAEEQPRKEMMNSDLAGCSSPARDTGDLAEVVPSKAKSPAAADLRWKMMNSNQTSTLAVLAAEGNPLPASPAEEE